MSELVDIAAAPGPSAELIFGDWYPAMRADELRAGKTKTALLLGHPLLLGRKNDGSIFAMRDLCPHRGIPLSAGWFDGERVTCKYHGWEFEPCSGQCQQIPSLTDADTLDATKIFAARVCVRGARRLRVGLYAGAGRAFAARTHPSKAWTGHPTRWPPSCRRCRRCRSFRRSSRRAHLSADLPCNVDHGIIGLMDPAHGPFVHQSWWWRSRGQHPCEGEALRADSRRRACGRNAGFRMAAHAPSSNSLPYKLLGAHGPVTTTHRLCAAEPALRDHPLRRQMVGEPDHGDAGDAVDLPHRRVRGVERAGVVPVLHAAAEVLRRNLCRARTRRRWWSRLRGCATGRR